MRLNRQWEVIAGALILALSAWGLATNWWGLTTPTRLAENGENAKKTAKCPVCGMRILVTPKTPKSEYQGEIYYFMNEQMKAEFEKAPEKFVQ